MRKRKLVSITALSLALALGGCTSKKPEESVAATTLQATEAVTSQQTTEALTTQQATEAPTTAEVTEEDTTASNVELKEQDKIREDDETINLIRVAAYILMADSVYYMDAKDVVTVKIDVANKTIRTEGFVNMNEQFVSDIHLLMAGEKTTFEQFVSDAYNTQGRITKIEFRWNPTLYTWNFEVINNVPGSKYEHESYDPGMDNETEAAETEAPETEVPETKTPQKTGKTKIEVMSFLYDEPYMIREYLEKHPDFAAKYDVRFTVVSTDNYAYQYALDAALQSEDEHSPNLYMAEAAFVKKYTTGSASSYACTYEELGIDVEKKIKDAGIATYVADVTRRDGKVTGLAYQGCGCVFIYNREVAKDVFGDDNPATIEAAIGTDWETFFDAAEKCKEKGYAIVSGDGDIWHAIENSADQGWVVDGKLYIDPKREAFLDYSKRLKDNNYHNDTMDFTEGWFADMAEIGPKKILGFYGPMWLINFTMVDHCDMGFDEFLDGGSGTFGQWAVCRPNVASFWGGTWLIANKNVLQDEDLKAGVRELIEYITLDTSDTGIQFELANDRFESVSVKCATTSSVVMERSDGRLDILGGQDAYPYIIEANAKARGDNLTEYDEWLGYLWRDAVRSYTSGELTRDGAIQWFKNQVREYGYFHVD